MNRIESDFDRAFASMTRSAASEPVSECCGAAPLDEICDGFAMCSDCKEHAEFLPCCPDCDGSLEKSYPPGTPHDGRSHPFTLLCIDCNHRFDEDLKPVEIDPTPYCGHCKAMDERHCHCGPISKDD